MVSFIELYHLLLVFLLFFISSPPYSFSSSSHSLSSPLPSLLMDIYLTSFLHPHASLIHASHSPPLPHTLPLPHASLPLLYFVPHFLCATLRWAGSSFTTNTPSLVPTEKERHWNMEEWKVEGGRWREVEGEGGRKVEGEGGGRKGEGGRWRSECGKVEHSCGVMVTHLWRA